MKTIILAAIAALAFASSAFAMGEEPKKTPAEEIMSQIENDFLTNEDVKIAMEKYWEKTDIVSPVTSCDRVGSGTDGRIFTTNIVCLKQGSNMVLKVPVIGGFVAIKGTAKTRTKLKYETIGKTLTIEGVTYKVTANLYPFSVE